MIRDQQDFKDKVLQWCQHNVGECPEPKEVDVLWEILELQDYVERLYILSRDDARSQAEEIGYNLDALEEQGLLPDNFWPDVQKGVESGLGCWDEVMQTAVDEVLSLFFASYSEV